MAQSSVVPGKCPKSSTEDTKAKALQQWTSPYISIDGHPAVSDYPYGPQISTSPQSMYKFRQPSHNGQLSLSRRGAVEHRACDAHGGNNRDLLPRSVSLGTEGLQRLESHDKKAKHIVGRNDRELVRKLGTFSGVFVPTTLNVLSILMFLRFGFILGQGGILGTMGMLIASYLINLVTTMSISAIATNGTVRGGGAYYLISRSLGPEFGGSIGIVLYLGFVFNTGMNAVGLVDCLIQPFGSRTGNWWKLLPEGFWYEYLWGTIVLVLCTVICLAGSSMFSRASNGLLVILLVATFSIPFSAIFSSPFKERSLGIEFTGFSTKTFMNNLFPRLIKGAAGSLVPGKENFQNLFGILFPATGGIFAGASMSGDLKNPSKAIPKGTLYGLGLTFITYSIVIISMGTSITRESLYRDINIIQDTNISGTLILLGEFATAFFSSLMGVVGSAKLLQAVARDSLLPGLSFFAQGTGKGDEPIVAIIFTFIISQMTMLFNINRIASFITMTYLMTFLAINLACFLLKIGSAPNFRPSFHYFNSWTAFIGTIVSGATMFYVDGIYASASVSILIILFLIIHYTSPPKSWGDVSQSLIYHQVRKYLLRLKPEHVKFWRPQILLFVDDFDSQFKMISFCNSLKKGGLFVLGHAIVSDDFASEIGRVRREQASWTKSIEHSKVKAFVNITISPSAEWGVRNVVLNSGLGGMRPNIVIIDQFRGKLHAISPSRQTMTHPSTGGSIILDSPISGNTSLNSDAQTYLTVLEDLLYKLRINVAVAKGFEELEVPAQTEKNTKKFIDLWPIQMSAEVSEDGSQNAQNVLTTNFDTYTLILQLGCILNTVRSWKTSYKLRVAVFVEYETDVDEEYGRVKALLEKLRIETEILVFYLASGELKSYNMIVNSDTLNVPQSDVDYIQSVLQDEQWWQEIQDFRRNPKANRKEADELLSAIGGWPNASFHQGSSREISHRSNEPQQLFLSRRKSVASLSETGVSFGMKTHSLPNIFMEDRSDSGDAESSSDEEEFEPYSDRDLEASDEINLASSPSPQQPGAGSTPTTLAKHISVSDTPNTYLIPSDSPLSPSRKSPETTAGRKDHCMMIEPSQTDSHNKFSSSPIPQTKVSDCEDGGPSIMFDPSLPTTGQTHPSIYYRPRKKSETSRQSPSGGTPATGYPSLASIPLSFNDLPCRAQHLILNELMRAHSSETAVLFTTLPSPTEGTWRDLVSSQSYLNDLDVLYVDLPPCLLVHSNSMTVTMNL